MRSQSTPDFVEDCLESDGILPYQEKIKRSSCGDPADKAKRLLVGKEIIRPTFNIIHHSSASRHPRDPRFSPHCDTENPVMTTALIFEIPCYRPETVPGSHESEFSGQSFLSVMYLRAWWHR